MEKHGHGCRGNLAKVEEEPSYELIWQTRERDGDGLGLVGKLGLPFRTSGAVDSGDGELPGKILVRRGYGEALGNVSRYGGVVSDATVGQDEST